MHRPNPKGTPPADPSRRAFLGSAAAGAALAALGDTSAAAADLPVTGAEDPRLASFDRMMVAFLTRHKIPGAALAVSRQKRLVYARGFGFADVEKREPVQPRSLFRIASVSKPFTSAAVMQLLERGKLSLNQPVFDLLKVEVGGKPVPAHDPRLKQVTVLQLLHHTGGWDRDKSFDPMFRPIEIAEEFHSAPPAGPNLVIPYMWKRPLDFDPGTRYAYSNFGYCVLGRVIEKVSGKAYEAYVREEVLSPLGVHDMRIGRSLPDGRAKGEARYYLGGNGRGDGVFPGLIGKQVPWQYGGWNLEAMDAHGGWIASAPSLVRFAAAFDAPGRCPILREPTIRLMFGPPGGRVGHLVGGKPKERFYACGWDMVNVGPGQYNTFHSGLLDGTSTILVRRSDKIDWAVLFNFSGLPDDKQPAGEIDGLVHEAADAVKQWPNKDLFQKS